ncbi:MAG: hypothetical protein ACREMY_18685, partial [bacterium]
MQHLLVKLVAAAIVFGTAIGLGQANAAPLPTLNGLASQATPVEQAGYYGYRRYGYGRYGYGGGYPYYRAWRPPYWYVRPYWGYGYG